ncbi:MAG: penicillin-binding protein 2 [Verrucomicrobia bacterium]|nr:penicillin-binding protein 2 [Verrucomicrobiota bacterium]
MDLPRTDRRIAWLICGFATLFSAFAIRLIQIQVRDHERYASLARETRTVRLPVPAQRGLIRDTRGETLAANVPMQRVVIDGTRLQVPVPAPPGPTKVGNGPPGRRVAPSPEEQTRLAKETARRFVDLTAELVGLDPAKRGQMLGQIEQAMPIKGVDSPLVRDGSPYLVYQRRVPETEAQKLRALLDAHKVRGVYFESEAKRVYPNGSLLAHVIGFVDKDGVGVQGVERTMEQYLAGTPGYRQIERDRTGRELGEHRGVEQAPRDGDDIVLTIDSALQSIVEQELADAVKQYRPEMATIVMMRPKTGEVLAMASSPTYDPNSIAASMGPEGRNRAISDMIEPGSTFKIVAIGGALNEKKVKPETQVFCENGRWAVGDGTLRDSHPYGTLSVHDVLVKSSNIGSAKLAMQLGSRSFLKYIRAFGFGERTGIELPGEINGVVHPVEKWSEISITRIPMGHEVGVTPLQMTAAMCAVANGGEWIAPRIIQAVVDGRTGKTVVAPEPPPVRRVLSENIANQVRSALEEVVTRGTAKSAAVKGFRVAGKTGTAQKVDPKNGGYMKGKYVVSFIGYLPAEDPQFVCLVTLDNAQTTGNQYAGGLVAGPIFSKIAEKAAKQLGLTPNPDLPGPTGPKVAGGPKRE